MREQPTVDLRNHVKPEGEMGRACARPCDKLHTLNTEVPITKPVARFQSLGGNTFFGGNCLFLLRFNKKCSGHNKISAGTKKLGGGTAPKCPPVATDLPRTLQNRRSISLSLHLSQLGLQAAWESREFASVRTVYGWSGRPREVMREVTFSCSGPCDVTDGGRTAAAFVHAGEERRQRQAHHAKNRGPGQFGIWRLCQNAQRLLCCGPAEASAEVDRTTLSLNEQADRIL